MVDKKIPEEEIRTHIVYQWLRDRGFDVSQIQLEVSFEIRVGRGLFRVGSNQPVNDHLHPRADILVKSDDGHNLFIFEIKSPNEPLDESTKEQGISYARLLRNGGIAPFVVLTNGHETQVYNSITGEAVSDGHIVAHPYLTEGIPLSINDDDLRLEALEKFVTLSADNLLIFCRNQVDYRMSLLRDEDPFSDKKYVPALYVDREKARERLNELIQDNKPVMLVTGAPQVGKTCFVCNTVERLLETGNPCLFFPAISMRHSLLAEIQEDFGWILGANDQPNMIARKLNRILERLNQSLIIVVDGWNEVGIKLAQMFSEECRRIHTQRIKFLISLTNVAAKRLLVDDRGNIGFIAEASNISQIGAVELLEVSPELSKGNVVTMSQYLDDEVDKVYARYCLIYGTSLPDNHISTPDPFLLRLGMQQFAGRILPASLDEPTLLEQSIMRKFLRVPEFSDDALRTSLEVVARTMFDTDAPIPFSTATSIFQKSDLPHSIYEAALLSRAHTLDNKPAIDFYYGRERDFIVAYWVKNWPDTLLLREQGDAGQLPEEVYSVSRTQVGLDAFLWFIQQKPNIHIFEALLNSMAQTDGNEALFQKVDVPLQISMLRALRKQLHQDMEISKQNLTSIIDEGISSSNSIVKTESAKLLLEQGIDEEEIKQKFEENTEWLEAMLAIDDEFPFEDRDSISSVILEALRDLHLDELGPYDDFTDESEITENLFQVISDDPHARDGAVKALAYIAPFAFFEWLSNVVTLDVSSDALVAAGDLGATALERHYFQDTMLCNVPSLIESLAEIPKEFISEYDRITKINWTMRRYYPGIESGGNILRVFQGVMARFENFRDDTLTEMVHDLSCAFDPEKRAISAEFLGELRVGDAVPHLIEALNDQSWFVEKAAADALFQIGTPEADKAYEVWRANLSTKDVRRPEFGKIPDEE